MARILRSGLTGPASKISASKDLYAGLVTGGSLTKEETISRLSDADREIYDLIIGGEVGSVFEMADVTGRTVADISNSLMSLNAKRLLNINSNMIEKYRSYVKIDNQWMSPDQVNRYNNMKKDNVRLSTGEWVSKDRFESLSGDLQSVMIALGIKGFQDFMKSSENPTREAEKFAKDIQESQEKAGDIFWKQYTKNLGGLQNAYYQHYYIQEGRSKATAMGLNEDTKEFQDYVEDYVTEEMKSSTFGEAEEKSSAAHRPNIPMELASAMVAEAWAAAGGAETYAQHRINQIANGMDSIHMYGQSNVTVANMIAQSGYRGLITGVFGQSNGFGLLQNGWLQAQLIHDFNTAQAANNSNKNVSINGQTVFISPSGAGRAYTSGPNGEMNYIPAPGELDAAKAAGYVSREHIAKDLSNEYISQLRESKDTSSNPGYSFVTPSSKEGLGIEGYCAPVSHVNSESLIPGYMYVEGMGGLGMGRGANQFLAVPGLKDAYYYNNQIIQSDPSASPSQRGTNYMFVGRTQVGTNIYQPVSRDGKILGPSFEAPVTDNTLSGALNFESGRTSDAAITQRATLNQAAVNSLITLASLIEGHGQFSGTKGSNEQQASYALSKEGISAIFNDNVTMFPQTQSEKDSGAKTVTYWAKLDQTMKSNNPAQSLRDLSTEVAFKTMSENNANKIVMSILNARGVLSDKLSAIKSFNSKLSAETATKNEQFLSGKLQEINPNSFDGGWSGLNSMGGIEGMNFLFGGPGSLAWSNSVTGQSGANSPKGAALMSMVNPDTGQNYTAADANAMATAGGSARGAISFLNNVNVNGVVGQVAGVTSTGVPSGQLGNMGLDSSGHATASVPGSEPGTMNALVGDSSTGFSGTTEGGNAYGGLGTTLGIMAAPNAQGMYMHDGAIYGPGTAPGNSGFGTVNSGNTINSQGQAVNQQGGPAGSGPGSGPGSGSACNNSGAGTACSNDAGACCVGSVCCSHVYSWDGQQWHFDHDGYIYAIISNLFDISCERLVHLKLIKDILSLKLTNDSSDRTFTSFIELYSVEYSLLNDCMMIDETVLPVVVRKKEAPYRSVTNGGESCLHLINSFDEKFWTSRYADLNDDYNYIIADFKKMPDAKIVKIGLKLMSTGARSYILRNTIKDIGKNNLLMLGNILKYFKGRFSEKKKGIEVEIWNGKKWIIVGSPTVGSERWTETLIVYDISKIHTDNLRVRIKCFPGWFLINTIFVDYFDSENNDIITKKIELDSAILNDDINVTNKINNRDKQFIDMRRGDSVKIVAKDSEPLEGNKKEYFVKIGGYYDNFEEENKTFFNFCETVIDRVLPALFVKDYFHKFSQKYAKNPIFIPDFVRQEYLTSINEDKVIRKISGFDSDVILDPKGE